jgi:hypothetical protein
MLLIKSVFTLTFKFLSFVISTAFFGQLLNFSSLQTETCQTLNSLHILNTQHTESTWNQDPEWGHRGESAMRCPSELDILPHWRLFYALLSLLGIVYIDLKCSTQNTLKILFQSDFLSLLERGSTCLAPEFKPQL